MIQEIFKNYNVFIYENFLIDLSNIGSNISNENVSLFSTILYTIFWILIILSQKPNTKVAKTSLDPHS